MEGLDTGYRSCHWIFVNHRSRVRNRGTYKLVFSKIVSDIQPWHLVMTIGIFYSAFGGEYPIVLQ